ncbi:MAG: SAM-dependent methyltransferase [Rhodospirillales bacterium]|nr:SAM-dependent methyltransferase [Alphaproteobacteria bacterium]MBL6947605.1 SAM-dependent methyltransferase [Rhodospirillales bacterium]
MPGLSEHFRQRIAAEGPLTVARYMDDALGHPRLGYYMGQGRGQDPFGRGGDFITAPEISQMFGELIGLWSAIQWQVMGEVDPFHLVELGPGRGTLMSDVLRAGRGVEGFLESLSLSLVEISPALKGVQEETLLARTGDELRRAQALRWISDFSEVPEGPFAAIGNEFLDALPIHQYQMTDDGWRERLVDVSENGFQFTLSDAATQDGAVPPDLAASPGDIIETRPAAKALVQGMAARLNRHPGCVLFIDYGHERTACGETLQAVKDHAYHEPLSQPGTADLTAHVDFGALSEEAADAGAVVYGPVTQGRFLAGLSIQARAEALAGASPAHAQEIAEALTRLTSDEGMGHLFKVVALTSPGLPVPPGFE